MCFPIQPLTLLLPLVFVLASGWSIGGFQGQAHGEEPRADPPPGPPSEPTIRLPSTPRLKGAVSGLAFAPDGKTLAVANDEAIIRFYDPITARERRAAWDMNSINPIQGLVYSPDGAVLAVGLYDSVPLLDTATGKPRITLRVPEPSKPRNIGESVSVLAFAPDGKTLAGSGLSGRIVIWDVDSGRVRSTMQGPVIPYRRPSPTRLGVPGMVFDLAISPNGKTLATAGAGAIRLWDLAAGHDHFELDVSSSYFRSLAFSPDGTTIAVTVDVGPTLGEHLIVICDTATGRKRTILRGHEEMVSAVRYLPDGKTLVSIGGDRTVRLWDAATGRPRDVLQFGLGWGACSHLAVSPDGRLVATGGQEAGARFGVVELIETDGATLRPRGGPHH